MFGLLHRDLRKGARSAAEDTKVRREDAEILESLPPEARKVMATVISMQRICGPMPNPVLSKLNEAHVDKIFAISEKEEEHAFQNAQSIRRYNAFYFIGIIALIVFLVTYLADRDKTLLLNLLEKAIYVLAGFGGGMDTKRIRIPKKNTHNCTQG